MNHLSPIVTFYKGKVKSRIFFGTENIMYKIAFHNLGCKVNSYETDAMIQALKAAGYSIVEFCEVADAYIINTCSVTNMADRKSRQMLNKSKQKNPSAIIVAVGCYIQSLTEEEIHALGVDLAIGNNKKINLVTVLGDYLEKKEKQHTFDSTITEIIDINAQKDYEALKLTDMKRHTRAFIKVQDGCNQFCSYCIIPYVRGRVRSRSENDILEEIKTLAKNGTKEFVLTGIHLSSYGVSHYDGENDCLIDLIEKVCDLEGVWRVRLGSLEPRIISDDFLTRLKKLPAFCPHFHLSLQSGSDETLRRMNRKYTTKTFETSCQKIRNVFHKAAITTDIIVGFPGESDKEFCETKEFLEKVQLCEMHIFKYSRRKGTAADRMENQIADSLKQARSNQLMEIERDLKAKYKSAFIGRHVEVLVEEVETIGQREYYIGYTKEYVKVALCAMEHMNLENQIVDVVVEKPLNDEYMLGIVRKTHEMGLQ